MMFAKSIQRCSTLQQKRVLHPLWIGYSYDEIDKSKTYQIRSFLNHVFKSNLEQGFHLAQINLLDAFHNRDFKYLSQITAPRLCLALQNANERYSIKKTSHHFQDVIYTDMTVRVTLGDSLQTPAPAAKLKLFDFINVDICVSNTQRIDIQNLKVELEMFILADQFLLRDNQQHDEDESIYHRLVFETILLEEARKPLDFSKLISLSSNRKVRYLRKQLLGKNYEWRIKEIDNFVS